MAIATIIAIYFVSWWITLFGVLPLGVRSQAESGEVTPGTEPGAPAKPRLLRIIGITSLAAIPVAYGLYALITLVD